VYHGEVEIFETVQCVRREGVFDEAHELNAGKLCWDVFQKKGTNPHSLSRIHNTLSCKIGDEGCPTERKAREEIPGFQRSRMGVEYNPAVELLLVISFLLQRK
jgi:hypothetical protein